MPLKSLRITIILLAFTLSGCKEATFSSDEGKRIDSFVELLYETPEIQRKTFFDLYTFYTLPYENERGEIVTPDIRKLDGLTAKEVMKVISDHYDMIDYQSQHGTN